jgi:DNA polymerase V
MAFQNPAQNFTETRLNLGDLVHLSPYSTYLMRSESNCPHAGIVKGSVLAIDRALTPAHRQLIVAEIDGKLTLRRLLLKPVPALQALDADETVTLLDVSQALPVWGMSSHTPSLMSQAWDSPDQQGSSHVRAGRRQ